MTQVLSGLENQLHVFMLSPSGSNVPLNQGAVLRNHFASALWSYFFFPLLQKSSFEARISSNPDFSDSVS